MPDTTPNPENLKKKAADGLFWSGLGSVTQQVLNLMFGVFLARILSEDDYGMANLLAVFIALSYLIQEGGFRVALINRKNVSYDDYNSVFWTSFLIGLTLYLIFFFTMPLLAGFLNEPDLIPLGRFQFLAVLAASISIVPSGMLTKELKNKCLAKSSFAAVVISGTLGVILAYNGFAYWGIAAQSVCYVAVNMMFMWFYSGWRPSFKFSFKPVLEMLPFSIKLLISNIFTSIGDNLFTFIIGKSYNKYQVGIYAQGAKWTNLGQQTISNALEGVAQPVLVKAAEQEKTLVFNKLMRFCVFVSFPCMFGFGFVAPEIIPLAIGDKWIPSVTVLQILCVWAAFYSTYHLYNKQLLSAGQSGSLMWITICRCVAQIATLFFTISQALECIAIGYVSVNLLFLIVIHIVTKRYINISTFQVFKNIAPYLLATAGAIAVAWQAADFFTNVYALLAVKILTTCILYVGALYISGSVILREAIYYLKGLLKL
ncbi:MAG: lipopolysaccharide biosynthesis protein [Bacteroidales bacterium]|nr:lipopolysaccharide biosynthesis protein [Bacteroidales bacterium]